MHAYLIFGSENDHPLAWLLNKRHRHVWCIVADLEHQTWVSYDWGKGLPELRTEASLDFDIQGHYESHGYDVVAIPDDAREAVQGPLVLNNCVGHVKSVLGIGGLSFVPHQLYRQVTRQKACKAKKAPRFNMATVPGFGGGGSSAPLPPWPAPYRPPPPPAPPPQPKPQFARNREAEERTGSAARQLRIDAERRRAADLLSDDIPDTLL